MFLLHGVQRLLQRDRKLVGAGRGFEAAADAFQPCDQLLGFAPFTELGKSLRVAGAAAVKRNVRHRMVLVDLKFDAARAGSFAGIGVFHSRVPFRLVPFLFIITEKEQK